MTGTIVVVFSNGDCLRYTGDEFDHGEGGWAKMSLAVRCNRLRAERPGVRIWEEFS